MRILWINEHAAPVGGAERYVRETAAGLQGEGWENLLLYAVHGELDAAYVAGFTGAFPAVDLAEQVRRLAPDVVYLHRPVEPGTAATLAGGGVPVAAFHHDYDLFCPRRSKYTTIGSTPCSRAVGLGCWPCLGFLQPAPGPLRVRLVRPGSLLAAQVPWRRLATQVVGSRHMAAELARHGFPAEAVEVIPLFAAEPAPAAAVEEDGITRILFAGQLVRGKGLDLALAALAALPAWVRLEVAGGGHQEGLFRRQAAELGLAARVAFLGRLDQARLSAAYRRAACVVVPSRYPETFGLVGVEAMAHGVPVVGAAVGAIPEWLDDGVTGLLVPPNDAPALARAMGSLLADEPLRRRLGAAGQASFAARFRRQCHLDRLREVLERTAARGVA
jgi:glycosyltransferase involved in cell wall biosynthesis